MRRTLFIVVKCAITVALLYFVIGRTNFSAIAARLGQLDVAWLLAAASLAMIQLLIISVRWQWIAVLCGGLLTIRNSIRYEWIAAFFNQVLPSTVGGDAVRTWMFARNGAGWLKATYSVVLDRFIGVLAIALLVVACFPWSLKLIVDGTGRIALLAIGLGSLGAATAFVLVGHLRWNALHNWAPTRHLAQISLLTSELLLKRRNGVPMLGLSVVGHLLTAAIAWSVARSVSAPFEFWHSLMLVPPVVLITTIPISIAGWGVREGALVLAFGYAGLPQADGLLVSLLFGLVTFAVGLAGGLVWLAYPDNLRVSFAEIPPITAQGASGPPLAPRL